ncbi:hypothetical protein ACVW0K_007411 [Streptomyces filamentosus]
MNRKQIASHTSGAIVAVPVFYAADIAEGYADLTGISPAGAGIVVAPLLIAAYIQLPYALLWILDRISKAPAVKS